MKTKNWIQLIGYLGGDPEIKECKNGNTLAVFRLATDERLRRSDDENGTESKYKAVWHNIAVWGKDRIAMLDNVINGSHVMVEGKLEYHKYQKADGKMKYITEINAFLLTDLDR